MPFDRKAYDAARYAAAKEAGLPWGGTRDKARKAAYDRARRERLGNQTEARRAYYAERWRTVLKPRWVSKATGEREPVVLPAAYTGHQWLELARRTAGAHDYPRGTEQADRREDEMGVALLALLEGQDPVEAVRAYRKQEYVARHLTQSISDWQGDPELDWKVDTIPQLAVESAEDVAVAREAVLFKVRYHGGQGKALMGTSAQSSPSNRRSNRR